MGRGPWVRPAKPAQAADLGVQVKDSCLQLSTLLCWVSAQEDGRLKGYVTGPASQCNGAADSEGVAPEARTFATEIVSLETSGETSARCAGKRGLAAGFCAGVSQVFSAPDGFEHGAG